MLRCWLTCLMSVWLMTSAHALKPDLAARIAAGEGDSRIAAINEAVLAADASLVPFVQALLADEVKVAGGRAFIVRDGKVVDAATGAATTLPEGAEDVVNNNRMRRELGTAVAALGLISTDRSARAKAIATLKDEADEGKLPLIDKALAAETDAELKAQLELLRAAVLISSADAGKRAAAAKALAGSQSAATRSLLLEKLGTESDPAVKAAIQAALDSVPDQVIGSGPTGDRGSQMGLVFASRWGRVASRW